MSFNQNMFNRTKQRVSENCHVGNVFLTCTRGPGPPSHCKAAVSAENDEVIKKAIFLSYLTWVISLKPSSSVVNS